MPTKTEPTKSAFSKDQARRATRKPDYTQLPIEALERIALRFVEGEEVYGRDNWKKGGPEFLLDCINHAFDHLACYASGDISEDHLGALGWFVCCMTWHEKKGTFKDVGDLISKATEKRKMTSRMKEEDE